MPKRFGQNFDGRLRCDLARFCAAHAIGDGKDVPLSIEQVRIFIERALLVQAAIRNGRRLQSYFSRLLTHLSASQSPSSFSILCFLPTAYCLLPSVFTRPPMA